MCLVNKNHVLEVICKSGMWVVILILFPFSREAFIPNHFLAIKTMENVKVTFFLGMFYSLELKSWINNN
jgi:hypothetical protein